jgi:hypothetical protein
LDSLQIRVKKLQTDLELIDGLITLIQRVESASLRDKVKDIINKEENLNEEHIQAIQRANSVGLFNGFENRSISEFISKDYINEMDQGFTKGLHLKNLKAFPEVDAYFRHWNNFRIQIKLLFENIYRDDGKYFDKDLLTNYFTYRSLNIILARDVEINLNRDIVLNNILSNIETSNMNERQIIDKINCLNKKLSLRDKLIGKVNLKNQLDQNSKGSGSRSFVNKNFKSSGIDPKRARVFFGLFSSNAKKRELLIHHEEAIIGDLILEWEKDGEDCQ